MIRSALFVSLSLLVSVPALADTDPKPKQPESERMICKKQAEIGSLARVKKQCFTKAQWDRFANDSRNNSNEIIDRNRGGIITN